MKVDKLINFRANLNHVLKQLQQINEHTCKKGEKILLV